MRKILAGCMVGVFALSAACGGRKVQVRSDVAPVAETSVHVTNNWNAAVNVYVINGNDHIFLKQVAARSSDDLAVRGVASGTMVTLQARTVDGSQVFTKSDVRLQGVYNYQVP